MIGWGTVDHGTIVGVGDHHHNNRSYTISITMTDCIVTRNSKHLIITHITVKQYLRDQFTQHTDELMED